MNVHESVPEQAVKHLLSVVAWLETYKVDPVGLGFTMSEFVVEYECDYSEQSCGTTCCIAGKIYLDNEDAIVSYIGDAEIYAEDVGQWLGLPPIIIDALFYGKETVFYDGKLSYAHTEASCYQWDLEDLTPKQAAKAIKGYLETGVVSWKH